MLHELVRVDRGNVVRTGSNVGDSELPVGRHASGWLMDSVRRGCVWVLDGKSGVVASWWATVDVLAKNNESWAGVWFLGCVGCGRDLRAPR